MSFEGLIHEVDERSFSECDLYWAEVAIPIVRDTEIVLKTIWAVKPSE
jgi:hypothetical protein